MDLVKACDILIMADPKRELQLTTMSKTVDAARGLLAQVKHQQKELAVSYSSAALPAQQTDNVSTRQQDNDNGKGPSRGAA